MISIIFRYYNENGDERLSIGSYDHFKQKMKTAQQLVEWLAWEHTEQWRSNLTKMNGEELMNVLHNTLESDDLHKFHPN